MTNGNDSQPISRRTVLEGAVAGGAIALTGCLSSDGGEAQTLRIASTWEPTIDPLDAGLILQRFGITESLVGVSHDIEPVPELSTDWTSDNSARHWEFSLREGVTFHDGTTMDADAVVRSLRRAVDSPAFADIPIEAVRATDDLTVTIETASPLVSLPAHLTRPKTAILSPAAYEDGTVSELIGTGPLKVESWEGSTIINAVRNEDYYGEVPTVESARYETITDDQTRRLKLENGDLEMARILSLSDVEPLRESDDIDVEAYQIPRCRFLVFDTTTMPFDEIPVRQAVNYAIDKETIVETVLEGVGKAAVGPFPASVERWHNPDLDGYTYDVDTARTLLSEAGWTNDSEGDVRTRDGTELSIEILAYNERPRLPLMGEILQRQLGAVGIDVKLSVFEYTTMMEQTKQDAFDCYLMSLSMLWYPDPERLSDMYHSEQSMLEHGYENQTVDTLLETARETMDYETRKEKYDEVQAITLRDAPTALLTYYTNVVGMSAGLDGYRPHPTESDYGVESITLSEE
ncbi:ABC transporter substrate-binding protein [Halorhabdus sp. CBA1104]|uniref:ABC transporter substrate-binding protein n=1 Tax=Halorhabdus sp. CBA1104 TaxID=1380432 RepID=UPI0012B22F61|nr:ABC transporter substrate-binding protein [Halorhabdus sp. CBA1104]QGN05957.1 ABC transporter substrate-binding protein [Halorhabdus sp. CBA1104]